MSNYTNPNTITRKCDICFVDVDPSYKQYVIHILQNHNPYAAKDSVPDKYILESVLKGNVTTKKNCDICNTPISLDVYDYIMHIQKTHMNLINKSLLKYVPDKYVVSVLINKSVYSQSSNVVFCVSCGDEVEMEDYREHMIEHKKMKQLASGFYGTNGNPINKGISPFGQSHSQFQQGFQMQNLYAKQEFPVDSNMNKNQNLANSIPINDVKSGNVFTTNQQQINNFSQNQNGFQKQNIFAKEQILLDSNKTSTNKFQNQANPVPINDVKTGKFSSTNHQQGNFSQNQNGFQKPNLCGNEEIIVVGNKTYTKKNKNQANSTPINDVKTESVFTTNQQQINSFSQNQNGFQKQTLFTKEDDNIKIPKPNLLPKEVEANKINDNKNPNQAFFNNLNNNPQLNSNNQVTPSDQKPKKKKNDKKPQNKMNDLSTQQNSVNKTDNNNNNFLNNLNQNDDLKNVSTLIELMKGNSININFNINNNNVSNTTNNNNNAVTTVNNASSNNEEIDKLKNQIGDMKCRIETLEVQQSQTIEEHENLQVYVHKKMNETNFKMKDIEKEVLRISELEAKINENVTKIDELENSKKIFDKKLTDQEKRIDTIESDLQLQKKELETQFEFLNSKNNALFADKLNQVEKELNKVNLELKLRTNNDIDFSIPTTWSVQSENLMLFQVQASSKEYQNIKTIFDQTMAKHKIKSIQRIQNKELWKNFCFAKYQLMSKGNDKTMRLFHGTLRTDPKEIYSGKEEGFDLRYSQDGYFGRGIYFHQRANYSHEYRHSTGGFNFMFAADVLLGDYTELKIDKTLRFPPFKDSVKKARFDSVKSDYDGIHVVYNNMRAYPSYLIEYEN